MKLIIEIDTDMLTPDTLFSLTRLLRHAVLPEPAPEAKPPMSVKRESPRIDKAEIDRMAGQLFVRACNCDAGYEFTLPALYQVTFKKNWSDLHPSDGKAIGRHFSALAKAEAQAAQPCFSFIRKTPQNMAVYHVVD